MGQHSKPGVLDHVLPLGRAGRRHEAADEGADAVVAGLACHILTNVRAAPV